MQTLRNAENTRSFNNDKGTIHLPRQYFPKTLKTLNLSYVLDSMGTFY